MLLPRPTFQDSGSFAIGGTSSFENKKRGRGLGGVGPVGEDGQVADHASLLVVEAEELVDSRDCDYAQPSGRNQAETRSGPTSGRAFLLNIASVCVSIPVGATTAGSPGEGFLWHNEWST
jgi:hypothetical protein